MIFSGLLFTRVKCKTWTWTFGKLANSADQDQTPQNVVSDQGLHCLHKLHEVMDKMKQSLFPIQDYFPSLHLGTINPSVLSVLFSRISRQNMLLILIKNTWQSASNLDSFIWRYLYVKALCKISLHSIS